MQSSKRCQHFGEGGQLSAFLQKFCRHIKSAVVLLKVECLPYLGQVFFLLETVISLQVSLSFCLSFVYSLTMPPAEGSRPNAPDRANGGQSAALPSKETNSTP